MLTSKLELLVDWGELPSDSAVRSTLEQLREMAGVEQAQFVDGAVVVETNLPSSVVTDALESFSGRRAVLQGYGENQSAVAMISSQECCRGRVLGVVRFQQSSEGPLVVDGTIDGLTAGSHGLHVHEAGDLSQGCQSIGRHYDPHNSACHGSPASAPARRHAGDLGNITADETGRATFRIVDRMLKVWDIVGRSVAVTERPDDLGRGGEPGSTEDGNSGNNVACGVIARSAGVFQNPKRVCLCDGVVVWDERERPLAGRGRRRETCCCGDQQADPTTDQVERKSCCDKTTGL